MLDRLVGFDWDVNNIAHITRHGVTPADVEQATARRHVIVPSAAKMKEERWKLLGTTNAGRYLVVVFTIRKNKFRTVTAYTMNQVERRVYAPHIDA